MRFLANENFPFPSIKLLRKQNFDVKSIGEEHFGISDEQVMNLAVEENRIILTFDRDYGELIFKYKKESPPAIIYFRTKGNAPNEVGLILLELIEQKIVVFENHFTVIDDMGIRQRKLI